MAELIQFISDIGFPIVVTLYLLHRIEQKLDTVVLSIERVQSSVENSSNTCRLQQYHK